MQHLGWNNIPRYLTVTEQEANERYKNTDGFSKQYCGRVVFSFDDGTRPETRCYLMKGAKGTLLEKHRWYPHGNFSYGGYVTVVANRFLQRKFPNGELTWDNRGKYYKDIHDILRRLSKKYPMETRTSTAVKDHIYAYLRQDDFYD